MRSTRTQHAHVFFSESEGLSEVDLALRLRILASWHAIDQLITLIPFTVESLNLFLRDIDISHSCTVSTVH